MHNNNLFMLENESQEDNLLFNDFEQSQYIINSNVAKIEDYSADTSKSYINEASMINYQTRHNSEEYGINVKSQKKLLKDKELFCGLHPKIQKISLSNLNKSQKVHELANIIESERIIATETKLKGFINELLESIDDFMKEKASLQRDLASMIEMNKCMLEKLKEFEEYFKETKNECTKICGSRLSFSISKEKESLISYLDEVEVTRTVVISDEEQKLRKVEEEEGFTKREMSMVELLLIFKNKVEGESVVVSEELIERISKGETLKEWIKKIDEKISSLPKVCGFDFDLELSSIEKPCIMTEFIDTISQNKDHFIENIRRSPQPEREAEFIRSTAMMTFNQIITENKDRIRKEEGIKYFEQMNETLCLIEKMTNTAEFCENRIAGGKIEDFIHNLY